MLVMKRNLAHLRTIGLMMDANQEGLGMQDFAKNIIWTFCLTSTIVAVIAYLIVHITDMNEATQAAYVICALMTFWTTYWLLAFKRYDWRSVMRELQRIVDSREYTPP